MASTPFLCEICDKPGEKRCTNCRRSYYCSKRCQTTDWPIHKILCKENLKSDPAASAVTFLVPCSIVALVLVRRLDLLSLPACLFLLLLIVFAKLKLEPTTSRPSPKVPGSVFRRAIYFHPAADCPSFTWIEFRKEDIHGRMQENPVLLPVLGRSGQDYAIEYIHANPRTKRMLPHSICVQYRARDSDDGSKMNKGIEIFIDQANGTNLKRWRGPVVFYGLEHTGLMPGGSTMDLNASDLRHIVDWLQSVHDRDQENARS